MYLFFLRVLLGSPTERRFPSTLLGVPRTSETTAMLSGHYECFLCAARSPTKNILYIVKTHLSGRCAAKNGQCTSALRLNRIYLYGRQSQPTGRGKTDESKHAKPTPTSTGAGNFAQAQPNGEHETGSRNVPGTWYRQQHHVCASCRGHARPICACGYRQGVGKIINGRWCVRL